MQSAAIPRSLLALAFLLLCAPCSGALVLSAPTSVMPGDSFTASLTLSEPWPLLESEVVDQVDVVLTYDPAVLTLDLVDPVGLLVDQDGIDPLEVVAQPGESTTASFLLGQNPFGPGALLNYHFTWLAGSVASSTPILVTASPSMLDLDTGDLRNLATGELSALAEVEVIPEPATWLLLLAGLVVFLSLRRRSVHAAG
jgi:hypothetical protein